MPLDYGVSLQPELLRSDEKSRAFVGVTQARF